MLTEWIPLIDAIGTIAFLFGFRFAWKIIPHAGDSRAYWIIFSFAMLNGFAWALTNMMESLGLSPMAFEPMQPVLAGALFINLSLAGILSYISITRPFD